MNLVRECATRTGCRRIDRRFGFRQMALADGHAIECALSQLG